MRIIFYSKISNNKEKIINKNNLLKKVIYIFVFIYINLKIFFLHSCNYNIGKPKISIFLAIYNKGLYLKNCIESLQKQTLKDIEIVAINDGSTDNSLKVLKKLSKSDHRIKIINNDRNHGALYSRAMGILNSSGEYLINIDSDDKLINKNDLEILYETSNMKNCDVILYLIKRIAVNKSDSYYFNFLDNNQLNMVDTYITNKFVKRDIFIKALNEFKKEIYSNIWNFHEDNIWSYLVRKNANSIIILNRYIYYYKRNKDSLNKRMGNEIEIKHRYYRYKKLKEIDYNNSVEYSLNNSLDDIEKYDNLFNNREIRTIVIHFFVNFLKLYSHKMLIYKRINSALNKISDNKIIIFYEVFKTKNKHDYFFLNIYKFLNLRNKTIISVNINNEDNFNDIKNFIYSKDILIFLDSIGYRKEVTDLLNRYKNNKIITYEYILYLHIKYIYKILFSRSNHYKYKNLI
jgi:glycosyltransferase involved in cell wall biosynthesis